MNDSRRVIVRATVAGVIASIAMGMFAMVAAATYQDTGFFTPLYHITSLVMSPSTMMGSMMAAQQGTTFTFAAGPAFVGLMIHMMTGAMFGAIFGVVLTRLPELATLPRLFAGAAFGVAAFAASTFILLPLASLFANDTDAIDTMAKIVGYPTFLAEHVVFGLVLGLLSVSCAALPARKPTATVAA
jgi:uncharacterized membrane protein YagU involved in acid resistance